MKRYIILISTVLFCMPPLFWSCKESFLDQEVPLVSTEAIIYKNKEKTEMALLGLYTTMKGSTSCNFMAGRTYIAFDNRGDDITNIDPNGVTLYMTYNMRVQSTEAENADAWYYSYLTINRANVFMESIDSYKTADVIGADLAKQYVSEAKFLRALSYYYLLNLYSQPYILNKSAKAVPLRLTGIKEGGHSDMACSTNGKIYEAILNDLTDSDISALPATTTIKNRATKAAALMLKMRVLMAMGNWAEAIKAGEAITGYQLVSDVTAMFTPPYDTNESIFSLGMSANDRPNTQRSAWEYYNTGKLCVIDKTYGVRSLPQYSLGKDKRSVFDNNGRLTKYDARGGAADGKLISIPIFRYAETKLNLAECYAKNNNENAARAALSDVRRRSVAAADDGLDIAGLSGSALLTAITNEKRLEFIGEGMRGIEIIRKGENFNKPIVQVNIGPDSPFYTWPIPDAERVNNALWNEVLP